MTQWQNFQELNSYSGNESFYQDDKEFTFKRRAGILIPRELECQPFYILVKADLTRTVYDYQTEERLVRKFFFESEKFLTIPRFFPIENFVKCKIEDISHEGRYINISHNITPKNNVQKRFIEYMSTEPNGLIKLEPGMGKTVVSIAAICNRGRKTFILVHKESLADQWIGPSKDPRKKSGFLDFTNIDPNDIVRLTSNNFQDALNASIIVTTAQTYISLLKRKRIEFLTALNKADIGVFISDEIHTTTGAPAFSECSMHMPSRVMFGLSATPERSDGTEDVIQYHCSGIISDDSSEGTLPARVTVMLADLHMLKYYNEKDKKWVDRTKYFYGWGTRFNRARYLSLLRKSKPFMSLIMPLINKLIKDKRDIVIMGERVDKLLQPLHDMTKCENKGMFIGGSSELELQKQIIFTTPGKMRDGVDAPNKDCLVMTSPIGNVTQATGRVTREWPGHDKPNPLIIDIVDLSIPEIRDSITYRLKHYESKNWDIQYILIKNNIPTKISKKDMEDLLRDEFDPEGNQIY